MRDALRALRVLRGRVPRGCDQLVGGENCSCCVSSHDLWYDLSSISIACLATLRGRKLSIITASSLVYFAPMLASARPGCGP